jgi:hypothetical protein
METAVRLVQIGLDVRRWWNSELVRRFFATRLSAEDFAEMLRDWTSQRLVVKV